MIALEHDKHTEFGVSKYAVELHEQFVGLLSVKVVMQEVHVLELVQELQ